jgi:hypothetical protein
MSFTQLIVSFILGVIFGVYRKEIIKITQKMMKKAQKTEVKPIP